MSKICSNCEHHMSDHVDRDPSPPYCYQCHNTCSDFELVEIQNALNEFVSSVSSERDRVKPKLPVNLTSVSLDDDPEVSANLSREELIVELNHLINRASSILIQFQSKMGYATSSSWRALFHTIETLTRLDPRKDDD